MLDYEKKFPKAFVIVGVDEAGRGCLAGPVVAAAVILPVDYHNDLINDSKKLTPKLREKLFIEISNVAIASEIAVIEAKIIDEINIYQASKLAMLTAIKKIDINYDLIITDAMKLDDSDKPVISVIKADQKSLNVAAASIIAKVTRDKIMEDISNQFPNYGFSRHKGYPTIEHKQALIKYGPIINVHRYNYRPVKEVIKLFAIK